MAITNNIINEIIKEFMSSQEEVVVEIRKGLSRNRAGLSKPHNLTGNTSRSIEVNKPTWNGNNLTWKFDSEVGAGLNQGVSTPISGGGGVYQAALLKWINDKFGVYGREAEKRAYFLRKAIEERGNPLRKGWFDEIEPNVNNKVSSVINRALQAGIDKETNRLLNKNI